MSGNISFNPLLTTTAAGSFSTYSDGYVQGQLMDDPVDRQKLFGGPLNSTETLPIFGGVGLYTNVPGLPAINQGVLGTPVGRASTLANLTAFSLFNQAHNWISSPQSPVPLGAVGMTVPYVFLGSGARITVAIDPSLASLDGGLTTQQVSWDFVNQRLVPYEPTQAQIAVTAGTWAATNGGTATITTASAHGLLVGDDFTLAGNVPAAYNGSFTAIAGTTGDTIVFLLPAASTPGSITTDGYLVAGGGALPVQILNLNIGNSKTVVYSPTTGFATWNNAGSTALIKI